MEKSGEGKYTEEILVNRRKGGMKKEEQRKIEESIKNRKVEQDNIG